MARPYLLRRRNRPTFELLFDSGRALDSRITFTRSSGTGSAVHAMIVDATGKWTYAPNNLVLNSGAINSWPTITLVSVSADAIAGYNGSMMDKIIPDGTSGSHFCQSASITVTPLMSYIASVDLKAGGFGWARISLASTGNWPGAVNPSVYINLSDGSLGTISASASNVTVTNLGDGIYRLSFKATTASSVAGTTNFLVQVAEANNDVTLSGVGTDGIYADRVSLEAVTYETASRGYNATGASAYYGPRFTYNSTDGTPRLWVEPTMINVALWNRDLTNPVWTSTNCTPLKDQTGIDGLANSASKITATAANGTCLQAITHVNAFRWTSAYVKRITGTGTIEMTIDNGTTWTPISVTGSWARVSIPGQTNTNTTVGFRIATSGDAIAVDFVQVESNSSGVTATLYAPTTPIYTTSASVTRLTDNVSVASGLDPTKGTWVLEWEAENPEGLSRYVMAVSDGTGSNRVIFYVSSLVYRSLTTVAGVASTTLNGSASHSVAANTLRKAALFYDQTGFGFTANGEVPVSLSGAGNIPPATLSLANLGGQVSSNTAGIGAKFKSIKYYNRRLSDAELQLATAA